VGTDPANRVALGVPSKDGQKRQRGTSTPVPSEASELNLFTGLRASKQRPQCLEDRRPIVGYAEVGPVKVIVWPWRLPAAVR
jgi:hypothetical protein